MKFIFNILLILLSLRLSAQGDSTGHKQPESNQRAYTFHNIKMGANITRLGRTIFEDGIKTGEIQASLGIHIWDISFDYGEEAKEINDGYLYTNEGSYYRIGVDRNFVQDQKSGNALTIGLRYAKANFEDQLIYSVNNGFGQQELNPINEKLSARWFELALGLRGRVLSNLYSGFTLRWQFARNINDEGNLKTFAIPGFGNTKRENSTGFDYYLLWRIPFGKG